MNFHDLPKQPTILKSYWNVGKLLYGALLLFIIETLFYYSEFHKSLDSEDLLIISFWLWCLMFSFIHMFLVLADVWSRFQNYKRVKDQLFRHGFTSKIAKNYMGSKCQRMAFLAAAKELGLDNDVKRYYQKSGVAWYHFIPIFMLKDPLFLFRRYFWSRTFLERYYSPKFDFRNHQNLLY
ncbi:hypothetical protein [Zunongwangia endophytica]|uniref:Uncharacterized protein n=1 Tax=Zunongwangia endophytica TaxID=1808945 RepID=A0ABV8H127_9FLAO|nr:hypothetical protein [Zunongwangia endophytica]MDN3594257.1 hypothetical protein [Zunongwangia endophytica]